MNFYEAKEQLEKDEKSRERRWEEERTLRCAAGKATILDKFVEKPCRWYENSYWACWRFFKAVFKGGYYRNIKNNFQRAKNGYGKMDWWNLDSYLAEWLPKALREFKNNRVGYPSRVYDYDGSLLYELKWDSSEEELSNKEDNIWGEVLERMAQGFEAHILLDKSGWMMKTKAEKELQRIEQEGLFLFARNFSALWD